MEGDEIANVITDQHPFVTGGLAKLDFVTGTGQPSGIRGNGIEAALPQGVEKGTGLAIFIQLEPQAHPASAVGVARLSTSRRSSISISAAISSR